MDLKDYQRLLALSLKAKIELKDKLSERLKSEALNDVALKSIETIIYQLNSFIKNESITTILNQVL